MIKKAEHLQLIQTLNKAVAYKANLRKTMDKATSDRISAIMDKLRTGQKLTNAELAFLREHTPQLYGEAVRILKAREREEQKKKEEIERLQENIRNKDRYD